MIIERNLRKSGGEVTRASIFLTRNLSQSFTIERSLERKSLALKKKIVEARGRTLRNIASRSTDSQKSGGIGGALGLLGLGITRKIFRPKVPKTPSALSRIQRGATSSKVGQLGRVGRLARPLAVVGTGLDFIGRRAEGQSNVQAGVGAAGGLAGSLAGAKYGAILGTAIGGPIGTAVGGVGGAIIGGLAGGRLADLFTGANKRRQFEEERVQLRTQKTLYSEALDDFDRVLDKFEKVGGFLVIRRSDDEEPPEKRRRFPFLPILPDIPTSFQRFRKFVDKPAVKVPATIALVSGLAVLLGASIFTPGPDEAAILAAMKAAIAKSPTLSKLGSKQKIVGAGKLLEKQLKRDDMLSRMSKSPFLDKKGNIVPGKEGAPGISKSGMIARNLTKAEKLELKANKQNIELQKKIKKAQEGTISEAELKKLENDPNSGAIINEITRETGKGVTLDPNKFTFEAKSLATASAAFLKKKGSLIKSQSGISFNKSLGRKAEELRKIIQKLSKQNEINPKESTKIRLEDAKRALEIIKNELNKYKPKTIKKKNNKFNPKRSFENQDLSSNLEPPDGTDIALAPTGNIFLLNQQGGEGTTINSITDNGKQSMRQPTIDPYSTIATLAMFDASLTT